MAKETAQGAAEMETAQSTHRLATALGSMVPARASLAMAMADEGASPTWAVGAHVAAAKPLVSQGIAATMATRRARAVAGMAIRRRARAVVGMALEGRVEVMNSLQVVLGVASTFLHCGCTDEPTLQLAGMVGAVLVAKVATVGSAALVPDRGASNWEGMSVGQLAALNPSLE